jgi:hypothetical protein
MYSHVSIKKVVNEPFLLYISEETCIICKDNLKSSEQTVTQMPWYLFIVFHHVFLIFF